MASHVAARRRLEGQDWVAGGLGFEPRLAESESAVLPLDDPPTQEPVELDSISAASLKGGAAALALRDEVFILANLSPPSDALTPSSEERRDICAALDLGTNNCRLLIARRRGDGFHVIDAFSRIVRLGEGLAATGRLSDAAMDRTLAALRICAGKVARSGARRARYVATEACRRAANCGDFLGRVRRDTGIPIEIISTSEEAHLVVAGCASLLDPSLPHGIVFD